MAKRIVLLTLMAMFAGGAMSQARVTVVSNDGTETPYSIDATGEIFFGSDYMAIMASSNATEMATYQMDDVRKVLFEGSVRIVDVQGDNPLSLTPNPANESFVLHGMADGVQTVSVYSMSGALMIEGRYSNGESIDISSLAKGIYMVRACTSVAKLIKR